jgi:hypothetical protein
MGIRGRRRRIRNPESLPRIDRRRAIQWMLGAVAAVAARDGLTLAADAAASPVAAKGYGLDPNMVRIYKPGDVWPLTLTDPQRRTTRALCDGLWTLCAACAWTELA